MGYVNYGTAKKENHRYFKNGTETWTTHSGTRMYIKKNSIARQVSGAVYNKANKEEEVE